MACKECFEIWEVCIWVFYFSKTLAYCLLVRHLRQFDTLNRLHSNITMRAIVWTTKKCIARMLHWIKTLTNDAMITSALPQWLLHHSPWLFIHQNVLALHNKIYIQGILRFFVQFAVCSVGARGKHLAVVLYILCTSPVLVRNLQNSQGLCMNLYVSCTILSTLQESCKNLTRCNNLSQKISLSCSVSRSLQDTFPGSI